MKFVGALNFDGEVGFVRDSNAEQSAGREIAPRSNFASGEYDHASPSRFAASHYASVAWGSIIVTVVPSAPVVLWTVALS